MLLDPLSQFALLCWGAFWGTVPDLVEWKAAGRHWRSYITHSPAAVLWPAALWVLLALACGDVFFGLGAVLAWASHVCLDALNPSGIPVRPQHYWRWKRVPYDSPAANGGATVASIIAIIAILSL